MAGKKKKNPNRMLEIKDTSMVMGIDIARSGAVSLLRTRDYLTTSAWTFDGLPISLSSSSRFHMDAFINETKLVKESDGHLWVFYEEVKPQNQTYSYIYFFLLSGLIDSVVRHRTKNLTIVGLTSSAWRSKLQLPNTSDKRVYRHVFNNIWDVTNKAFTDDEVESALIALAGIECIKSGEFGKARILYHHSDTQE